MPLFDFTCLNNHIFEELVNRDEPNPPCPDCGGETTKMPALVGKGVVSLYGGEINQKLKEDQRALRKEVNRNENVAHNILGKGSVI